MEILTSGDGKHRVGITYKTGELRVLMPGTGNRPPYSVSGNWAAIAGEDGVEVSNLSGVPNHQPMTLGHLRLLLQWSIEHDFKFAVMFRLDGRRVPCAHMVTSGDYAGWWRIDLTDPLLRKGASEIAVIEQGAVADAAENP